MRSSGHEPKIWPVYSHGIIIELAVIAHADGGHNWVPVETTGKTFRDEHSVFIIHHLFSTHTYILGCRDATFLPDAYSLHHSHYPENNVLSFLITTMQTIFIMSCPFTYSLISKFSLITRHWRNRVFPSRCRVSKPTWCAAKKFLFLFFFFILFL